MVPFASLEADPFTLTPSPFGVAVNEAVGAGFVGAAPVLARPGVPPVVEVAVQFAGSALSDAGSVSSSEGPPVAAGHGAAAPYVTVSTVRVPALRVSVSPLALRPPPNSPPTRMFP